MEIYTRPRLSRRRKPPVPKQHVYDGFPHYRTATGMCMCLGPCCFDDQGCRCKFCPCRRGRSHTVTEEES